MTGNGEISICGPENHRITIDADGASRVMDMMPNAGQGGTYLLKNLTLTGGDASTRNVPAGRRPVHRPATDRHHRLLHHRRLLGRRPHPVAGSPWAPSPMAAPIR